ncbi:MAG TPA: iron-sulfur cluster assembly scaffold protein [Chloroflexota bacterium]|nr:iron-sulfur cluster assembly scaffold protein [Chloroflexota bacterium]
MTGYSPTLLDHFRSPRNRRSLQEFSGRGHDENPVCGDQMTIWIRIEAGVVAEAGFEAYGCEPSIAAGSMVTTMVSGMAVAEAADITPEAIAVALGGLPPVKRHASMLASRVLRAAIDDSRRHGH